LAMLLTSLQQVGNFPVYEEITGNVCNGFCALEADFSALMRYINSRFTYLLYLLISRV